MKHERISDLSYKEVIHLESGQRLGYVRDAEIDAHTGKVVALIIPGRLKWLGLLGREPDQIIPWERIRRLGEDIIFVGEKSPVFSKND